MSSAVYKLPGMTTATAICALLLEPPPHLKPIGEAHISGIAVDGTRRWETRPLYAHGTTVSTLGYVKVSVTLHYWA